MHVIRMNGDGMIQLIPASSWHFEGDHDPDSWTVRVTCYGPSTSTTWNLSAASVIFAKWGSTPGQTYVGIGPLSWAHLTARLQSESERSLADEAGGPLAQLIAIPQDGGDGSGDDPLAAMKGDIARARGKALFVETAAAGWGEGRASAPQRDWQASRLGPQPPEGMATIADQTFATVLAACGCSVAMFDDSDGTIEARSATGVPTWHRAAAREDVSGRVVREAGNRRSRLTSISFTCTTWPDVRRRFKSWLQVAWTWRRRPRSRGL